MENLGRIDNLVEINKTRIFKINKLDKIDKSFKMDNLFFKQMRRINQVG